MTAPKDTLGCEGPTFQVCDDCSSPNLCRVYGSCPSTWPATQIAPDPLEQQVADMYVRLDQRQREIDEIVGSDADIDNIPGYNVRGLLLGAASLMMPGLMMWMAS